MDATIIRKEPHGWPVEPNLADYEAAHALFSWEEAERRGLSGERVFALAGRIPELYVAALGTLKAGAVFSPLDRLSLSLEPLVNVQLSSVHAKVNWVLFPEAWAQSLT